MAHAHFELRGRPLGASRWLGPSFGVLVALLCILLGRPVRAEPSATGPSAAEPGATEPGVTEPSATESSEADRASARALAAEGYEALKQGDFGVAADRFKRADELVHAPTLVVDHARALVGLGRLVEAYERYALVLREGVAPDAPWPFKRAVTDAGNEIQIVEARLAWLTVDVKGVVEPRVTLNGVPLAPSSFGAAQAVNPGSIVVRAFAAGYVAKEQSVTLAEGERRELSFELLREPAPAAQAVPAPRAEPEAAHAPARTAEPPELHFRRALTYAAFGVGGAGIVVGGVAGVLALEQRGTLVDECTDDGICSSRSRSRVSRYHSLGTISGVGFVLGLGGIGAGLALLWTEPPRGHREQGRVVPYVGAGEAGLAGTF